MLDEMRIGCPIEQSQVNLVHPPRATDPHQVQNKIIIWRIDLCEGLNPGPDTAFIMQPPPYEPRGTISPRSRPFNLLLFLSMALNAHSWKLKNRLKWFFFLIMICKLCLQQLSEKNIVLCEKKKNNWYNAPETTIGRRCICVVDYGVKHADCLRCKKTNYMEKKR